MATVPNGDIYATVLGGDIYKLNSETDSETGDFEPLYQGDKDWTAIVAAPNGDIYATVTNGDIYKQTGGEGSFAALGQETRQWMGITVAPNGMCMQAPMIAGSTNNMMEKVISIFYGKMGTTNGGKWLPLLMGLFMFVIPRV
jgi:hypothetical protein